MQHSEGDEDEATRNEAIVRGTLATYRTGPSKRPARTGGAGRLQLSLRRFGSSASFRGAAAPLLEGGAGRLRRGKSSPSFAGVSGGKGPFPRHGGSASKPTGKAKFAPKPKRKAPAPPPATLTIGLASPRTSATKLDLADVHDLNFSGHATNAAETAAKQVTPRTKHVRTVRRVIMEIYESEASYVRDLETLRDVYIRPLRGKQYHKFLPPAKHAIVFSNLEAIIELNHRLLDNLAPTATSSLCDSPRTDGLGTSKSQRRSGMRFAAVDKRIHSIGHIFNSFTPFLKMYMVYVSNYDSRAMGVIKALDRDAKAWRKFCRAASQNSRCRGLDINSFLIMPIQRVPRYRLLLQELLKKLEAGVGVNFDEDNIRALRHALNQVIAVAAHINNWVERREAMDKVIEIASIVEGPKMINDLVQPTRSFIREGPLLRVTRRGPARFWVWLFNDLIMYGTPKTGIGRTGRRYRVHRVFGLAGCSVKLLPQSMTDGQHAFAILSGQKSFMLIAPNYEVCAEWVLAIQSAIEKLVDGVVDLGDGRLSVAIRSTQNTPSPNADKAPLWQPDSATRCCMLCSTRFSLFRRRHHCRACGKVVCGPCSTGRAVLAHISTSKLQRLCDRCIVETEFGLEPGPPHHFSRAALDPKFRTIEAQAVNSELHSIIGTGSGADPSGADAEESENRKVETMVSRLRHVKPRKRNTLTEIMDEIAGKSRKSLALMSDIPKDVGKERSGSGSGSGRMKRPVFAPASSASTQGTVRAELSKPLPRAGQKSSGRRTDSLNANVSSSSISSSALREKRVSSARDLLTLALSSEMIEL